MVDSRIKRVFESLKSDVPDIVSSFHSTAERLSKFVETETFAIVTDIREQQIDNFGTYISDCLLCCFICRCTVSE